MAEHLAGHTLVPAEGDLGYERLFSGNRKPYKTLDGYISVLPYSTKQWVNFLELIGRRIWRSSRGFMTRSTFITH